MAAGPLRDITVLDLTSVVLGPFATQVLADQGARVIKVEAPEGDVMRHVGPMRSPAMGALFLNVNRGKQSLVLDLKQRAARTALDRLIARADVFIHSLRPQAARRLGLGWDDLRQENPRLVHCSAWGFASTGPYAEKPAYDDVIQALSGMADLAPRAGQTDAPAYAPTILADKATGLSAAYAIAMALFQRERTGEGVEVEVPMFETLSGFVLTEHLAGHVFRPPEGPLGYARLLNAHRRPYAAQDGHVTVMPYSTRQWRRFVEVMGRPELVDDPRLNDGPTRSRAIAELYALVAACVAEHTVAEVLALMDKADVPAMPVHTLESLIDDPHHEATGFVEAYEHRSEGPLLGTAPPVRFGGADRRPPASAPRLGEHSRSILEEAGLDARTVDALFASGATAEPTGA